MIGCVMYFRHPLENQPAFLLHLQFNHGLTNSEADEKVESVGRNIDVRISYKKS